MIRLLTSWTDLWFDKKKDYGDVEVTKFKRTGEVAYTHPYRLRGVDYLTNKVCDSYDTYISLNSFRVGTRRASDNVAQVRNIGVDLDFYKLEPYCDIDINDAINIVLENVKVKVNKGIIPMPSMVTFGHGIQLFWTIDNGVPASLAWATRYITKNFINRLSDLGADPKCSDIARIFRVPTSKNSRNGHKIQYYLWNKQPYQYQDFAKYVEEQMDAEKVVTLTEGEYNFSCKATDQLNSNNLRLKDLITLADLRGQDGMIGCRNEWFFWYGFHYLLTHKIRENEFQNNMLKLAEKYVPGLTSSEMMASLRSAWDRANLFAQYYEENGHKIVYKANDGIVKPEKSDTIIKDFGITEEEQQNLKTLVNAEIKRRCRYEYQKEYRRAHGVSERKEYLEKAKFDKSNQIALLKGFVANLNTASRKHLMFLMRSSRSTLYRTFKDLNTDKYIDIEKASVKELLMFLKSVNRNGTWYAIVANFWDMKYMVANMNDMDIVCEFIIYELLKRFKLENLIT